MSKKNKLYDIDEDKFFKENKELIEISLDFKDYQNIRSKRLLLRDSIIEKVKKKYDRKSERRKNKIKESEDL